MHKHLLVSGKNTYWIGNAKRLDEKESYENQQTLANSSSSLACSQNSSWRRNCEFVAGTEVKSTQYDFQKEHTSFLTEELNVFQQMFCVHKQKCTVTSLRLTIYELTIMYRNIFFCSLNRNLLRKNSNCAAVSAMPFCICMYFVAESTFFASHSFFKP